MPHPENDRQQSVHDVLSYTFDNQMAMSLCNPKVNVTLGFIAEKAYDMLIAPSYKCTSAERQQYLVVYIQQSTGCIVSSCQSECISRRYS